MGFWPQFELFIGYQDICEQGLKPSLPDARRIQIVFLEGAASPEEQQSIEDHITAKWACSEVDTAISLLADPRVFVTNGSDKAVVAHLYEKVFEAIRHSRRQILIAVRFHGTGLQDYAEALEEFDELEDFMMAGCANVGEDALALIGALARRPTLRRFGMWNCCLSDEAMRYLRNEAPLMPKLESFTLGVEPHMLSASEGLEDTITDVGVQMLAEALASKAPLGGCLLESCTTAGRSMRSRKGTRKAALHLHASANVQSTS